MTCSNSFQRLAVSARSWRCVEPPFASHCPVTASFSHCPVMASFLAFAPPLPCGCAHAQPHWTSPLPPVQDGAVKMGAWQMVLWQPRWVFAETDGFCYQKISTTERPIGKPKKITFASVREIEELDSAEVYSRFVLRVVISLGLVLPAMCMA